MKFLIFSLLFFLLSCTHGTHRSGLQMFQVSPEKKSTSTAQGRKWMISTQGAAASRAGAEMLRLGGNLFDAAVAVSFAISVERPQSTGIGGGGFLLLHEAKTQKVETLDFRERAPLQSHEKMYLDSDGKTVNDRSITGGLAAGTPGLVAGLLEIHQKYGRLKLAQVIQPAIILAEKGFPVYPALNTAIEKEKERLSRFPSSKKIFLDSKGHPWPVGHVLIQKDLGKTLRRIADQGRDGFYKGEVARKISLEMKKQNAALSEKDLDIYETRWRTPVSSTYGNLEVFSMPPPSSGGIHVLEILNILEKDNLKSWGPQDPRSVHLTASAMQMAFADRAQFLGDPDFVSVPVETLVSKSYAAHLRNKISFEKAISSKDLPAPFKDLPKESSETTHFTLMDEEGNVISSTQTINGWFGSALVIPETGILMNNEMDDFAAQVGASNLFGAIGGKQNRVQPLKRPLSSMSPTLVKKDGKPWLAVGTPSGTRIISCVAQTLLNRMRYDLPLWESVTLTRYHHQWFPEVIRIEEPFFLESTENHLKALGHRITHESLDCKIQAIEKTSQGLVGVSDPREEGLSLGDLSP